MGQRLADHDARINQLGTMVQQLAQQMASNSASVRGSVARLEYKVHALHAPPSRARRVRCRPLCMSPRSTFLLPRNRPLRLASTFPRRAGHIGVCAHVSHQCGVAGWRPG